MQTYAEGIITHSYKMCLAMALIEETVKRGEKILLFRLAEDLRTPIAVRRGYFSGSLITLTVIEDFLAQRGTVELPSGPLAWKRDETYFSAALGIPCSA